MYGSHLFPKIFKVGSWSAELNPPVFLVKPKKRRLHVNCKAFLAWVGDGVGGPLGGDKAYQRLALKHYPDKMKHSMKVVLKVLFSGKLPF